MNALDDPVFLLFLGFTSFAVIFGLLVLYIVKKNPRQLLGYLIRLHSPLNYFFSFF